MSRTNSGAATTEGNTGDTMTETQMEKAKRQYEQAKARLHATKAREAKQQRKRDAMVAHYASGARQKILAREARNKTSKNESG